MKIVIAYLYYDLLNLYGESGNLKTIKYQLENQGITPVIKFLTIDDKLDFKKYDLVLISAGTEKNQKIVLSHLLKYKKDIKSAINENKFFLITGNAIDLFGRNIIDKYGKIHRCLRVFGYNIHENNKRLVDDALFINKIDNEYIIGFQNQSSILKNNKFPLFDVIKGIGSYPNSSHEGIHYKNFYGTYLIGPLLVRNPNFAEKFLTNLIHSINPNYSLKKFDFSFELEAYDSYFNLHYQKVSKNKKKSII